MASQVFICYARRDFPFVRDLARSLTSQGVKVWFDVLDMSAGENYVREIDAAIAASDCVAVVVSPYSMASTECQREIRTAAAMNKRTVPVLLQAAIMPAELRLLQWIDFRRDYEQPLGMLLAFIRGEPRPLDAALALDSLPRPLNVGDGLPLAQIDCPLMVKLPLLLLCASSLLIMMLCFASAKTTGVPGMLFGLGYLGLFMWYSFRVAKRRATLEDARSLIVLVLFTLPAIYFTRPAAGGWTVPFALAVASVGLGLAGAVPILFSPVFRRWMVAYSHEPGQGLITNPFKRRPQQNQ